MLNCVINTQKKVFAYLGKEVKYFVNKPSVNPKNNCFCSQQKGDFLRLYYLKKRKKKL